ncbi:chitinase CLP-like [Rutidosis leptorrhynchoides]|uniref:chitinase CLP-like n=1 Tax=Rutidosis leptorrhynchoides TaxID=125765 RepID=UPI003A9A5359
MMNQFTIILFTFLSLYHNALSQTARYNTSVIPVVKDATTSLHKISLSFVVPDSDTKAYYLIDLDAPFTWYDCIIRHSEVACGLEEGCRFPKRCDTTECKEARNYINPDPTCPSLDLVAKYGCNICAVQPFNPISKTCKLSQLTTDLVNIRVTNGRSFSPGPNPIFGVEYVLSCAPKNILTSFPSGVRGVASYSWSELSFIRQTHNPDQVDKLGLCLPSSTSISSPGVSFLGEGPFYFTSSPNLDIRSVLLYTPMIRKTSKSLGYFIKIQGISIEKTPVSLPLLKGSSVKLSTVMPYTTLRSDIYKAVVTSFSEATKNIPKVKAIKPFSYCLKASAIGSVPSVDLVTESGKIWTISKNNLIKDAGNGAACLAFVDGGSGVKDPIVIGTFQMENNFLFFDLKNQKLGFSSSLLARGISCSNFNFTQTN